MKSLSMAGSVLPAPTLFCQTSFIFSSSQRNLCTKVAKHPSFVFDVEGKRRGLVCCSAKKKISFVDQILDYIEGNFFFFFFGFLNKNGVLDKKAFSSGGPKLRKWYGAPDLLSKDGSDVEDKDEDGYPDEVRDAVLVTDGDSEIGQTVILSLIVKRTRIKALVKDKRNAMESFGTYVESMAGDASDKKFLQKALRGVRSVICPNTDDVKNDIPFISLGHEVHIIIKPKARPLAAYQSLAYSVYIVHEKSTNKDFMRVSWSSFTLSKRTGSATQNWRPQACVLCIMHYLKKLKHVLLFLLQLSVYRGSSGVQALMSGNARKLAEKDESTLVSSGIPYTIIRAGVLQNTPGGKQGFRFEEGCAASGSLSKEDAASICVEALETIPQKGLIFEVVNGEEKVSDWKEYLTRLMEEREQ
ncbi:hypothetical protein JRO89_XS09G0230200 [Xanthoceras sorbifolium]|uniref:NAD(P)-binding domain-containing protein n=1 Tax=Xanthoceras sorbifolium TaxID=99658 RepID=A0ABQ8HMJ4_9ROSI|nr:hypothetical protein JRO89_XS09G0230200 [Xanthoceras sorbifolium]